MVVDAAFSSPVAILLSDDSRFLSPGSKMKRGPGRVLRSTVSRRHTRETNIIGMPGQFGDRGRQGLMTTDPAALSVRYRSEPPSVHPDRIAAEGNVGSRLAVAPVEQFHRQALP